MVQFSTIFLSKLYVSLSFLFLVSYKIGEVISTNRFYFNPKLLKAITSTNWKLIRPL